MWDDCHAVGLLCFFFSFLLMGYISLFLPNGLTNEYIISIFIFEYRKHIWLSANSKIIVIFLLVMKIS